MGAHFYGASVNKIIRGAAKGASLEFDLDVRIVGWEFNFDDALTIARYRFAEFKATATVRPAGSTLTCCCSLDVEHVALCAALPSEATNFN